MHTWLNGEIHAWDQYITVGGKNRDIYELHFVGEYNLTLVCERIILVCRFGCTLLLVLDHHTFVLPMI